MPLNFSDDENGPPKRLSLRERMALKNQQNEPITTTVKQKNNAIKEYRLSRDVESETDNTKRKVIRHIEDGAVDVKVRDRNFKDGEKEDVIIQLNRRNETKQAITEAEVGEETKTSTSSYRKLNDNNEVERSSSRNRRTRDLDEENERPSSRNRRRNENENDNERPSSRTRNQNDDINDRPSSRNRRRNDNENENEIERPSSRSRSRKENEADRPSSRNRNSVENISNDIPKKSTAINIMSMLADPDPVEITETIVMTTTINNGDQSEETTKTTHRKTDEIDETITEHVEMKRKGSTEDVEKETTVTIIKDDGSVTKTIEQTIEHHHHAHAHNDDPENRKDETDSKSVNKPLKDTKSTDSTSKRPSWVKDDTRSKNIKNRFEAPLRKVSNDNSSKPTLNKTNRRPVSVGDFKSKFDTKPSVRANKSKSAIFETEVKVDNKVSSKPPLKEVQVIEITEETSPQSEITEEFIVEERTENVESANIDLDDNTKQVEVIQTQNKPKQTNDTSANKTNTKTRENKGTQPLSSVGDFKSKFENKNTSQTKRPVSVGDFKSRFETKPSTRTNKAKSAIFEVKTTDNNAKTVLKDDKNLETKKDIDNKSETSLQTEVVTEEIIVEEITKDVESSSIKLEDKTKQVESNPTTVLEKKPSDNKVNITDSNFKQNKSARPLSSVGDFKSKFENRNTNKTNRPVSVGNFKSKFEQFDQKPVTVEFSKVNLKSTNTPRKSSNETTSKRNSQPSVQANVSLKSSDKNGVINKPQVNEHCKDLTTEVITKIEKSTNGEQILEQTTTVTKTSGHDADAVETKEVRTVETNDEKGVHSEKVTTLTEKKTTAGKYTKRTVETKLKAGTEVKVQLPSSASMDALLREKKKQQELAKKNAKLPKGKNAFKAQLEANAPKTVTLNVGGGGGGGMNKASSNIDKLLKWIKKRINQYPAVNVTNYTSSWADGIALCALMNYLLGDKVIDPLAVSTTDKKKNFELALKAATDAGVPQLLDATELATMEIDRRSMITYLHLVYKTLFADKQPAPN